MKQDHKKEIKFANKIMGLMEKSPTQFHVIQNNVDVLKENGYKELFEFETWDIKPGDKYFVVRENSCLCAFSVPKCKNPKGFMIAVSHSDHPCFRLTNNPNNNVEDKFNMISIEPCPNPMFYSYVDVPLSIAGKMVVKTKNGVKSVIVDCVKPTLIIPNLASHMRDNVNEKGLVMNAHIQMRPLFSLETDSDIVSYVAKENGINPDDVLDQDLFVYRASKPYIWGKNNEFMSSRAIDDQASVYSSLFALIESKDSKSIPMHVVFNNEEIGSSTRPGADSSFLTNIFDRIATSLGLDKTQLPNMISNSIAISADGANGFHPNYPEMSNQQNKCFIGHGPALKYSAVKSYCTNAVAAAIFKQFAKKSNVKFQAFYNIPGQKSGSTLSRFFSPKTSILSADIGIPQLAMHSGFETCSTYDLLHFKDIIKTVFSSTLEMIDRETYKIY